MSVKTTIMAIVPVLLLSGCFGDDDKFSATGSLNLGITDAPVDEASKVVVKFTGVELKHANGTISTHDFATAKTIDLLALQGGASEWLLQGKTLTSGHYEWLRLKVVSDQASTDSYIELPNGQQYPLYVPSGNQTGLKLVSGFDVPAGGTASFTIDFDLRKSVVKPSGSSAYKLKPALRLLDNNQVGVIDGTVASGLITQGCVPAVYLFEGASVTPDDVDGVALDPIASAAVKANTSGGYDYRIGFVAAGSYTLSFTCQAALDDPELNDALSFSGTQNVTVTAGQVITANF